MQNLRAHYDGKPKRLQTPPASDRSSEVSQATKSAPTAASPAPKSAEQSCSHGCASAQGFGVGGGREADSLGIYAKSITPPLATSTAFPPKEAGKAPKETQKQADKRRRTRAERFSMLSVARDVLFSHARAQGYEYANKMHRTTGCHFLPRGSVSVLKSTEYDRAFYAGLTTCGSVWSCPVCAAKIQERRRQEIVKAVEWAWDDFKDTSTARLQPMMVTLTFPHRYWHKVEDLLKQQAVALNKLRAGKPWQKIKAEMGYQGMIRSLEITHGKNGWHPHTHELWFVDPNLTAAEAKKKITARWRSACQRAGLLDSGDTGFDEHAVHVKPWCKDSDYLAKQDDSRNWGVDREVAKGTAKSGKGTVHPFGLLQRYLDTGEAKCADSFVEYSMAIRGRRQIYWSQGLKEAVGLKDQTDEELAEEQREEASVLGMLTIKDWRAIRRRNAQAKVLDLAETSGWQAIRDLVDGFEGDLDRCKTALIALRAMSSGMSKSEQGYMTGDDGRIISASRESVMPDAPDATATPENAAVPRKKMPDIG